ncbi:MAG: phage tail sheath subtilisin-like domain-containing protein [Lachnospiraceae bacterium]
MKAPSIDISFIEKGISAVTRSERGIVMLWVKDMLPALSKNPIQVITESDIPEGLSESTVEQVKLAMKGYTNAPKKILVYCMNVNETEAEETDTEGITARTDALETAYKTAMEAAETIRFDYLAIPTVETDGKAEDIVTWIKSMRGNKKKKIKAVLPNVAADTEGVINFTTPEMVKTETITDKDGTKTVVEKIYTTEQYCSRIAGLIAGTPITISCTYAPLLELSDCTRLTDIDTPVDKGEFILFYDGEKVKVVIGINSFVTTVDGKGDSFKKIKIVEAMDMIHDDITKTAQDSYLGKYANSYSNKCLLLSAINSYFAQLKADGVVSAYSVTLDAEAVRIYLKGKGLQATLDDGHGGVIKDVDECSDEEIITADTGSNVFMTANVKILDAIENIKLPVYI